MGCVVVYLAPFRVMGPPEASIPQSPSQSAAPPGRLLAFCGLRVRMGLHSGLDTPDEMSFNRAAGRVQYSGVFLSMGKYVGDVAAGGMVLLSESTLNALRQSPSKLKTLPAGSMVMAMGRHELGATGEDEDGTTLYQMVLPKLACRLPHYPALHAKRQILPSVFAAPCGRVAIVFMNVSGASSLLNSMPDVARKSLDIYHKVCVCVCVCVCYADVLLRLEHTLH